MSMDPFGGVPVTPPAPPTAPTAAQPAQPAAVPAQPGIPATPTAQQPAQPAAPGSVPGGFAAVVPDVNDSGQAGAGTATSDAPLPGFGGPLDSQPTAQQQPTAAAPAPASEPSKAVWHVGQPVVAEAGSMPNPSPYVESRKPVVLPDGSEVTTVPGEPVYTMPGDIREYQPERDRYGRYMHTHPDFGFRGSFTRATTIAKKLDSGSNLMDWRDRKLIEGLARYPELLNGLDVGKMGTTNEYKLRETMKQIAENATNAAGAADGREFGTALHAWTEAVDHGKTTYDDVPDEFKPFVASYLQALSRHGIEVVPEYVERIMYNPVVDTMGTIDRIYRLPTGELVIGDIKTSGNIDFAWTSIALQMGQYANATYLLSEDGTTWEPMPEVRKDIAVIAGIPHTPKDRGPHCDMHIINVTYGTQLLYLARDIAHVQSKARNIIPMSHSTQPGNADEAMAWVDQGMPSLATPGSNPLAQLEGLADESAQAALDAMDGDIGRYAGDPVVGEYLVGPITAEGADADRLSFLSDVAGVASKALRSGTLNNLLTFFTALSESSAVGDAKAPDALAAISSSASIRASRARTRTETASARADRDQAREVKAARQGAVSAAATATTQTAPAQPAQPAAQPAQPAQPAPEPAQPTAEQVAEQDEPRVNGIRQSVRDAISFASDPESVAGLYDPSWSEQEVELARSHMAELTSALVDAVRSQIDAQRDRDGIAALWEQWWPQELVDYASQRMDMLPPF